MPHMLCSRLVCMAAPVICPVHRSAASSAGCKAAYSQTTADAMLKTVTLLISALVVVQHVEKTRLLKDSRLVTIRN